MKTLIGVDVGTQGTKAALFDEQGRCLAQAFEASKLLRPKPGAVEEDPERQFGSLCRTIRRCMRQAGPDGGAVAGIGIDGQMAGIVGVGADGRNVTPYDSWLDTRCGPFIKQMDAEAGDAIVARTGGPPSFNHGPKILWWMHRRKAVFRRIASFVQPGGYAVMRLCGMDASAAFIDKTYLHFSGFADNRRGRWDARLCDRFAVPPEKLPRIVDPHEVVGHLTRSAARRCGLASGVPVVAGCGDTAASFLACGATAPGIGVDVAGTASVFAMTTDTFRADKRFRMLGCGRSAVPGLWHPYAYVNGGGMNLEWFRREIAAGPGRSGKGITLARLDELAEAIDPSDDLPLFVPHLGGRVCPAQPDLRGAWTGLSWNHGTGHLYRAVLEGVALEYAVYQQVLQSLYRRIEFRELRVTGGGERSRLWNQIKADVMQVPLRRVDRDEGAPLGAALLAGFGVGLFADVARAARKWISLGPVTRCRKKPASFYAQRLKRYRKLLQLLDPAFSRNQSRLSLRESSD